MKKFLLFIFTFVYFHCWSQGNMITINSTVPAQMTICGTAKVFTITIYNPSPFLLTNDTLKLTMPSGIAYQIGSVAGATELYTSIPNSPVFLLPSIPNLTTINISFSAIANCDVMAYISGGGIIENNIRVNYTGNNTPNYDEQTTTAYIVRQPSLSITTVTNQSYTGNIGDVFTRCITIVNGGLGELSQFTLTDVHGSGIQITGVNNGVLTNSGLTETIVLNGINFSSIGNGNNLFENGESITICETVHVLNCISVASVFEAYWGCSSKHCQSSVSSANVFFPNLIPNLVISPNNGNIYFQTNSCVTQASPQQLQIINTGLGQATNVQLDIFQSTGTGYQAYVGSYMDPASFTTQVGIGATPVSITPTSTVATASLACMSSPKGKVLLTIPSINAGDTVYVKWNTYSCCWNNCTGVGQYYINGWRYSGSYENICQSSYAIPENWGKVYSYIYGDLSNNSSPSTMTNGQTGTFDFLFTDFAFWYPVGTGAHWKLEYTLPTCLTYSGNLKILRSNGVNTWTPSSVVVSGNVVTAIFNGSPPWDLTQAEVKIDLTVDCASCGGTGSTGSVSIKSSYIPDASCGCEAEVSCQTAAISVICPAPCPEGMIFSNFDMKRTSYGLPDNEASGGNGLPDGTGSLDFTKIRTDRAMFGDTITDKFNGKVKTSFSHPSWQYCYVSSSITNGNYLSFLDATLKIYRGGVIVATCTSFTPTITNSGTHFAYDLSVLPLAGCLPAGFSYLDNDSLTFTPRYKVTSNTNGPILNCYSTNEFYLSDVVNPSISANKFQCGNFNGNCSIIGYYFTSYGPDNYSVKSCDDVTINQNYYLSIGPCCNNYAGGNLFPYEYRNWAHIKILTAIVPAGYNFISARFNQERTAGTLLTNSSPWVTITPVNPNSDTLTFSVEQYFQGYGGTIPLSDDGFYGTLQVTIRPSCKVTPTISQGIKNDWTFAATPTNYLTGAGSYPSFIPAIQDSIVYQAPSLFVQSTLPTITAPNNTASWDVCISNTSNVSNALNTWLSGPAISGVTIIKLVDLGTNLPIAPIGSIYQVGTVNATATRCFRITASFTSCSQDSIIVYSGWNCNAGYPTSVHTYPCTPKSIILKLTPLMPALIVNITAPPSTVQLCDTASYTVEGLNIQLGTAYSVALTAVLPVGVSIVPGSSRFRYPISNPTAPVSDPTFMGGTTWQWDVSAIDSLINVNGLKGVLEPSLNSFKLSFKVITNCGYTSGSTIGFNLKGIAACGVSTGQEVSLSSALGVTGATTPYHTVIKLLTTYISPCANNSTMKIAIQNQGPAAFSTADSVVVKLPTGVSFVNGSFSGLHNPPGNGVPTQFILNGQIYLTWRLPSGTIAGDSSVFTFNYKGDPQALSCEITQFEAKTTSSTNVTCVQSGNNCGINIATGDTTLSVFTYKAYLSLSNALATAIPNPPLGETVTVSLDITNTGQAILSGANSIIQFYYDANGNGIYNTGDVFLSQDTLVVTNNSIVHHSTTFNVPAGKACSIIAIVNTTVNACICNPSQLLIQTSLISLGNDSALCSGQTMTLSSPPVTGYTYSWSPATDLSSISSSNTSLTASNLTTLPVSTNYILTTNRMGCTSIDTIKITVNPIPVSNAGTDIVTCPTNTSGNIGTVATLGYTYSWLPVTGLSSITASNPTVTLSNSGSIIYVVKTTSLGCNSFDSVKVKVNPLPTATASGTISVCKDAASPNVTFSGTGSIAPYIFTYSINGGADQTLATGGGNSLTIAVSTNTAGAFTYSIVSVQDANSCTQSQSGSATVTVNPLPTATISGTTSVCKGETAPFITFTGIGNTAPYTFTYTINGGTNQTITTINGNSVNVAAPTQTAGTYIYSLVSLQDGSSSACAQTQSGNATVTVHPSPMATFSSTSVCKGNVTQFSDNSITVSGTISTWSWDFADGSILNSSPNPSYTYANPGIYNVTLIAGNSFGCIDTITKPVQVYFLPTPNFTHSDVCFGDTMHFSNSSSVDPSTSITGYLWVFADGSSSNNLQNPVHYYSSAGSYFVTLVTTTAEGCAAVANIPVKVYDPPTSAFTFNNTCLTTQAMFTNTSLNPTMGTIASWSWDFGDGTPLNTAVWSPDHLYAAPGNYIITLITSSSNLGCADTLQSAITVYPMPLANFRATPVCLHQMMHFNDSSTVVSGNVNAWSWNFGDGSPADTLRIPAHIYTNSGTYPVSLVAITGKGCKDTVSKSAVVHPLPDVHFSAVNVCKGAVTQFNDLTTIPITDTLQSWIWNFADNSPYNTNQNTSHLYAIAGSYHVQLVSVSKFGCSDSLTKIVVINPNPDVNFVATNTVGCEPLCVYFRDSSSIATGNNTHWAWNLGDGSIVSNLPSFEHCYKNDSLYSPIFINISLTVISDSGCVGFISKNNYVTIYPKPVAGFTTQPHTTTIVNPVITFTDLSIGADFWHWNFGDHDTISKFNPAPHTYADTSTYKITLTTSTLYGCVDTAYATITIEPDFVFYIPNAFTPNDDGMNDTFGGKGIFIKAFEMEIYDRWGNLVFYSDDFNNPWDGRVNHGTEIAQMDVYVYIIKVTDFTGLEHKYKGKVTLVK